MVFSITGFNVEPVSARPRAAGNVQITTEPGIEAHNSPTVAVHPDDPMSIAIAERIDRPVFSAALHYSLDGGKTWVSPPFPTPPGEDRPYAPDLAWAPDGTLYLSFVTLTGRGNNPETIWIASSQDGGATWVPPQKVAGPYGFQVRLAVDQVNGELHMTWLQASADTVGSLSFTQTGLPIVTSRSSNGGRTWTKPRRISDPQRERVGAASPVAVNGILYVLYQDFRGDHFTWYNLEGDLVYKGNYEFVLARVDGRHIEESVVDDEVAPAGRFLVYLPDFPSLTVDGENLYAAWSDARMGDRDVFVARSSDAGRTWDKPVRVNDDPIATGRDQYLPAASVADDGRVDVLFYDRRGDPNNIMADVFLTYSLDGAETFAPALRVSNQTFSSKIGPEAIGGSADMGSRVGLISERDRALAVWTDTRNGSRASARQDIYTAVVTGLPVQGRPFAFPALALTAGGVAGIGIVLLIFGRSRGPRPSSVVRG